jgi:hypothetical protein
VLNGEAPGNIPFECAADRRLHGLAAPRYCAVCGLGPCRSAIWTATPELRWFRPPRGGDHDLVLQQRWTGFGQSEWRDVQVEMAD